jgi:hypothetical protein
MDNMPRLRLETENEEPKTSCIFSKVTMKKMTKIIANYEQWPQGEESLLVVTFQPDWT